MDKTPLNQLYRQDVTFNDHPNVRKTYADLTEFSHQKGFVRTVDGVPYAKGRIYDDAVLFNSIPDFNGKVICELGARDGLFSSWLTQFAREVHVADYFQEWGKGTDNDLGDIDYWGTIWNNAAYRPDRLVVEHGDITNLSYPNEYFDVVICTSVVEHLLPQKSWNGDITGMREMSRVLKRGGHLLLSTDMTDKQSKWYGGTMYYNEQDLFDRIIRPSRCEMVGPYDFSFSNPDNSSVFNLDGVGLCSSSVFSLTKN